VAQCRPEPVEADPTSLVVPFAGKEYGFDIAAFPVLDFIFSHEYLLSSELIESFEYSFGREAITGLISELAQNGLVTCTPV
jgi:hypothetical protein